MTTTVATLQAIFSADTSQFDSAVGRVKTGLSGLGNQVGGAVKNVGNSITGMGAQLAMGAAPLAGAFGYGIKTATEFDSVLAEISARTGIVGDDLGALEQFALDMGATTAFSAQQAADAFLQLLTSGQSVNEAMATLPYVLDAAAASGAGLGQSADLLTDIMAAYGLSVDQAEYVTNALAKAAGSSSADMTSLGQGFANVGPIAKMYGLSVERTAAALAVLSENGIKGAEAGTALKSMLMNMTRPTEEVQGAWETLGVSFYDANGNTRDLAVVLAELESSLTSGNFTVEEQNELIKALGGSYGAAALQALMAGDSITAMELLMQDAATAEDVAAARMDTFAGAVDSLKGSIETLSIRALRPFMNNTLKPIVRVVTDVVNVFADWAAEHPQIITAVGLLTGGLVVLSGAMLAIGPVISFLGLGLGVLIGPVGWLAAAIAGLALAFKTDFLGIRSAAEPIFDWLKPQLMGIWDSIKAGDISGAIGKVGEVAGNIISKIGEELPNIRAKLGEWAQEFADWIGPKIPEVITELEGLLTDVTSWIGQQATSIAAKLVEWGAEFINWVGPQIDPLLVELAALATDVLAWIGTEATELADKLVSDWAPAFKDWVTDATNDLIMELVGLSQRARTWIAGQAELLKIKVEEWAPAFWEWVTGAKNDLVMELVGLSQRVRTWIAGQAELLKIKVAEWAPAFKDWVTGAADDLLAELPTLITDVTGWIGDQAVTLETNLLTWATEFVDWLGPATTNILPKLGTFLGEIIGWVLGTGAPGLAVGAALLMWELILWVDDAAADILPKLWDFIQGVGDYIVTDLVPALVQFAINLGGAIIDGTVSGLTGIGQAIWDKIAPELPTWDDIKNAVLGGGGDGGGSGSPGGAGHHTFGSRAGGGPIMRGQRAQMFEFGPEVIESPISGRVVTTSELAAIGARSGGRPITISGGTFILQGVQDVQKLYDELQRIAERRA